MSWIPGDNGRMRKIWGRRSENSRAYDAFGARLSISVVLTTEWNVISKIYRVVSGPGTVIGFPEALTKLTPCRWETRKKTERMTVTTASVFLSVTSVFRE